MYPTAGEQNISCTPSAGRRGTSWTVSWPPRNRAERRADSATRAKGKVRRYCKANRMRFLWTLTYADQPPDLETVKRHLRWFFRQLQQMFGRQPLVAVVELGSKRGRFHVHFAAARFLSIEGLSRCWHRGKVWVGDPRRMPGRVAVGHLARYLAKYVSKDLDGPAERSPRHRQDGQHRYHLAEGFQPECLSAQASRPAPLLAGAMARMGEPERVVAFDLRPEAPAFGYWVCWREEDWYPPPEGPRIRKERASEP